MKRRFPDISPRDKLSWNREMTTSLILKRNETWDGHSIANFINTDIMEKLDAM